MTAFAKGIEFCRWIGGLNVYANIGPWLSLGVHVSLYPLYIDLHVLWFVISVMSRERAAWIHDAEESYAAS